MMKTCQHQHKGKPQQQKKSRALQLLWRMQLRMQCAPVKPYINVLEEPGGVHAEEAGVPRPERGQLHLILAREAVREWDLN
jgi:hypothetical protein